ncbi:MAG: hypothetical protein A2Y38_10770 [Spirochaetes bacterium GWB1_59_5]|nr:MAG: hypothetical protein A2Y38_10770 [Spirochaetes bacterium GWB1_59_5]
MKKIVRLSAIALLAFAAISMTGCDLFGAVIASVSGKAVNAQAAGDATDFYKNDSITLVGASITLTNQSADGEDAAGTVSSDGTFSILDVEPGRYILSGSRSGWTFVPRLVDITGFMTTLPTVIAYPTPTNLDQILVLVEWDNVDYDVDSYMVRDDDAYADTPDEGSEIVAGYNISGSYYTDPSTKILLDRDVTNSSAAAIPRVETISISNPANAITTEYLRYYIRLFNQSAGSLTGNTTTSLDPAGATVFVMQGTDHYGTYPIAYNSAEQVLGVVAMRWNVDDSSWDIGSFGGAWLNGDGAETTGIKSIGFAPVVVDSIQ